MPRPFKESILSLRDLALFLAPVRLLVLLALWVAYLWVAWRWVDPMPPRRVVLATGSQQGAHHEFGKRYVEELKRFGILVEMRSAQGAPDNLRRLRDPNEQIDLAFVQGGASRSGPPLMQRDLPCWLANLIATVGRTTVPLSHADELYALRSHSEMVRRRLQLIVAGQRDSGPMLCGGERAAA
jgi:hypothetical protein